MEAEINIIRVPQIGKQKFKDLVFITYAGCTFCLDWFPAVKDNMALAKFMKEKIDKAERHGYIEGFQAAKDQYHG